MVFEPNEKASSYGVSNAFSHRTGVPTATDPGGGNMLSLRRTVEVLRRRIWLLSGVTLATSAGTSALMLSRPPVYSGTFSLLVEPATTGSRLTETLTLDTQLPREKSGSSDDSTTTLDYVSQISVLKSQTLLDPIIKRIQTRYPQVNYGTLMQRLKITRSKNSKILDFAYESRDRAEVQFVLMELSHGYLQYSINNRKNNLSHRDEFLQGRIRHQRREVAKLESELERFRHASLVVDPEASTKAIAENLQSVAKAKADNRAQLLAARAAYIAMQRRLRMPTEEALNRAALSESATYQAMAGKVRDLNSQIATESVRFTEKAPVMRALRDQRRKLMPLLQRETQRVMGTDIDPEGVAQLKFQGSVERDLTKQYIEAATQVNQFAAREREIERSAARMRRETQRLASIARGYRQITHELEVATNSLNRLLTARGNLQLEAERKSTPWELISKLDETTVKPKISPLVLLVLGAIASFIVGVAAALLADKSARTFQTVKDLKETKLPCLGVIPFNPELDQSAGLLGCDSASHPEAPPSPLLTQSWHQTNFLEAFYLLDINLRLLNGDDPVRAITISSVSAGDGKSTIATYFAIAAASMGRRVLLIDADMRRPQVHHRFNIPNQRGLSNAIGFNQDVMTLIQKAPHHCGLYLLPTGPLPPSPGRYLGSGKMRHLMDQLREHFDLILCDAPPLLGLADAKLAAACTDGILLTVEMGKTDADSFAQMVDELGSTSRTTILGVVANGVTQHQTLDPAYDSRAGDRLSQTR